MKLLPPSDLLRQMEGVEEGLKENRRSEWLGLGGIVASVALPVVGELAGEISLDDLSSTERLVVGLTALLLFLSIFLIVRSRLWIRESRQPFSYTCSLGDFTAIGAHAERGFPELSSWLGFDLAERLNDRIGRLAFLDEVPGREPGGPSLSHIHITGQYLARERTDDTWMVEVTPRIWIGGAGSPATLAHPVKYACHDRPPNDQPSAEPPVGLEVAEPDSAGESVTLTQSDYDKIVERVYFSVATEIYRQIRRDVKHKISLLPTRFLRATAYYYEAEDYAASNTLDAFDEARALYREAIQLYDRGLAELPRPRPLRRPVKAFLRRKTLMMRPLRRVGAWFWPRLSKKEVMTARAEIGYAKALLYRRSLAGMSGHKLNPIYEARPLAKRATDRLEKLAENAPGAKEALVDAYIALALANYQLEYTRESTHFREKALALAPARCEQDPHYLYLAGVLEPGIAASLPMLRQAVERDPRFEVARFEFALRSEMLWRTQRSLEATYATMVIEEYEAVLKLDPGNVRAWSNLGYMRWLQDDLTEAAASYERGCEYTQIQPGAHVASLDWGLARIAAERGDLARAYHHYLRATSALLAQGVSDSIWTSGQFYFFDFVGPAMLDRFERYLDTVTRNTSDPRRVDRGDPDRTSVQDDEVRKAVQAFALTDYGEACHTYYVRSRSGGHGRKAAEKYREAVRLNSQAFLPHYDLYLLNMYEGDFEAAIEHLDQVRELEPTWDYGHVAWVAAHTEWAAKKFWEKGVERVPDGRRRLPAEVRTRAEKAKDPAKLRSLLPHDWLWKGTHFRWNVVSRRDLARTLRWEKDMDDGHVRALLMWTLAHLLLEGEQQQGERFRVSEKVLAANLTLDTHAREFLKFIREHFWPGNFLVLLTARQLLSDEEADDHMRELVERWLKTDPTAYWALRLATREFIGEASSSLLGGREQREYLEKARATLRKEGDADGEELRRWIDTQLSAPGS